MESQPKLSRTDVREKVVSLLAEIAKVPRDEIVDTATIDGTLRMESVHFVELQVALEEEYQIELDPIEVVELNQLGAIVDYVHRCAVASAAA